MYLNISLFGSPDVQDVAARIQNLFREKIDSSFRSNEFESKIDTLLIFPTLINPSVGSISNSVSKKKSENSIWITINIEYNKWIASKVPEKVDLFTVAILSGIAMTSDKHISKDLKAALAFYVSGIALDIRREFERPGQGEVVPGF